MIVGQRSTTRKGARAGGGGKGEEEGGRGGEGEGKEGRGEDWGKEGERAKRTGWIVLGANSPPPTLL